MNWSKGFSSRYYATIVDPTTWRDIANFDITGGTINISEDNLRTTADLNCVDFDRSHEYWVRVYLDARQEDDTFHGALFTGLASSPSISLDGNYVTNNVQCYSVLKPLEDILLPRGWYALANTNCIYLLNSLLSATPAHKNIDIGSMALDNSIIAESGETYLSMLDKILYAMNLRLVISGDGTITISEPADYISGSFDAFDNDCLETSVTIDNDWYSCPNVFRAISGDYSIEARDENEDSILSIPSRRREIWMEETVEYLYAGESLSEYASRRLSEEQNASYQISYNRRYDPNVNVSDLVRIHYPEQNIDGTFYILSQSINLGHNATVSEVAYRQ